MKYFLNGVWNVQGVDRLHPEKKLSLTAEVPGNIELDLHRNGIEPDPYYSDNEFLYKKYETWDWEFTRKIEVPDFDRDSEDVFLVFEGLTGVSSIFLGEKQVPLDTHGSALIPHRLSLFDAYEDSRHIEPCRSYLMKVTLKSPFLYAMTQSRPDRQGYPMNLTACEYSDEYTFLRMPAHSFGWDIMPRFLSAGMWRDVYIEVRPRNRIDQTYFVTRGLSREKANILYKYRLSLVDLDLSAYRIRIWIDDELKEEASVRFTGGEGNIHIDKARLWWPRGYGNAETYRVRTELVYRGEVVDSKTETLGIRQIEIVHKMAAGDEGEFLIKINGCPILAKGANWVPLDAFHSRDKDRYEKAVQLFADSGCNIMRLWGGNVYENDILFELCDKDGILVWHDFSFACAVYPQNQTVKACLKQEADTVIRRLRNHPCILLWAGDNEIDETYCGRNYTGASNRYNPISREVLSQSVRENDPYRMYLPSSPYIDGGIARYEVPEQHLWGPRAYYKDDFYRLAKAHFVSEYGYHGCPSPESIRRFIPEEQLTDMRSPAWKCHSSEYTLLYHRGYDRNQLMRDQVELMFGSSDLPLDQFSFLSQFTQAEALKFMIEQTRLKKWRRTGLIWWNMLDGWPQISDSAVDWYFVKKRSFQAVSRAQEPVSVIFDEASGWTQTIILANDSRQDTEVTVCVRDADSNEIVFEGSFSSRANQNETIGEIRVMPSKKRLLLIDFTVDGERHRSHYLCGFPPFCPTDAVRWAKMIDGE